mgnify:CR=1 FL=1
MLAEGLALMDFKAFELTVSYSQVAVFIDGVASPFSLWVPEHVHQGFAWRPDSASFRTLADGKHSVVVASGAAAAQGGAAEAGHVNVYA